MADLLVILNGIKGVLDEHFSGSGETVRTYVEFDQIQTPAMIIEPQSVDWEQAMNRGLEHWDVTIRALSSTANLRAGMLERYKHFGGAKEIKDVIESAVELRDGTIAQDVFVRSAQNFGVWVYNDIGYVGVEFSVDVYA